MLQSWNLFPPAPAACGQSFSCNHLSFHCRLFVFIVFFLFLLPAILPHARVLATPDISPCLGPRVVLCRCRLRRVFLGVSPTMSLCLVLVVFVVFFLGFHQPCLCVLCFSWGSFVLTNCVIVSCSCLHHDFPGVHLSSPTMSFCLCGILMCAVRITPSILERFVGLL